ncbi:MAG: hypothetical protein F6K25_15235 [Okeania sp. SIO2G4]|uniref:hypothetical protein n=1 Tax=unclassified Okeania TaxID=2634635 RepID=UPI0013B8140E|nr:MULTISPECIES: hypothetical protein [unclassified Okeania]NEP74099.1 hypothetical protein [Okeania sp. SIO2G5]NEP95307.1 hypothetical protein [Okeania sp. SIO2F5]NEQ91975.1 hypothetical protein [Okeania sp. SIO2G4]
MSLVHSQTAVNEIVNQLQKEISSRVEEQTKTYTKIPYLFMKIVILIKFAHLTNKNLSINIEKYYFL